MCKMKTTGNGKQAEPENAGKLRSRGGRHGKQGAGKGADGSAPSGRDGERSPTQRAKVKVAIAQVTTAFLNAYVKHDQFAIEWLNKDAQPWLYSIGQLQEK